jgi:hypothetical protein
MFHGLKRNDLVQPSREEKASPHGPPVKALQKRVTECNTNPAFALKPPEVGADPCIRLLTQQQVTVCSESGLRLFLFACILGVASR